MPGVDHTHSPELGSWVPGTDGHADFPIQNLPLGVFSPPGGEARGGIAIGDSILDLRTLYESGLLDGRAQAACLAASGATLNPVLAHGAEARTELRRGVSALLSRGAAERPELLHRAAGCQMYMPAQVGDYTDFYAGIHHATNVGKLFRPDSPLMPNYKWVPIGYHGRASSLRPSGVAVRRPNGQRKRPEDAVPSFGPTRSLDFELELGIWMGPGNALGSSVTIGQAREHIAGYCLLNDWSARDVQAWEYQPLGPFLAKSFQTTISPWIITPEALAPFRVAQPRRGDGDPEPLAYLLDEADQRGGALDLELEVLLRTEAMRRGEMAPHRISLGSALNLYWTPQQLVAHHSSNGCNLRPGDLLGSGTISSPTPDGYGSLLEMTYGGRDPIRLPSGEERRFLEDGDEVILCARAWREGYVSIGFGECRGAILPALT
ncbi:MAG TPA: fumarylacetoacetase [Granulicella sp.]|jgi:fumarylacetoacetase|nr:fumarylacetoacetase [Granulicella sp.]